MKETRLTLPQLSVIAVTRAVLGAGMALLFADRLNDRQRKRAGWALFMAGVTSTIPLVRLVLDQRVERGLEEAKRGNRFGPRGSR